MFVDQFDLVKSEFTNQAFKCKRKKKKVGSFCYWKMKWRQPHLQTKKKSMARNKISSKDDFCMFTISTIFIVIVVVIVIRQHLWS